MKNKILLNKPNTIELVSVILGGLLLVFLISNWTEKVVFLLVYWFIIFGIADNRNYWFIEQKMIVSHLSFFRRSKSLISKVCNIDLVRGWGPSVPTQVKLTFNEDNKQCSIFNMADEEFMTLFNQAWSPGLTETVNASWSFNPALYNLSNLKVIVFVQHEQSKSILQATSTRNLNQWNPIQELNPNAILRLYPNPSSDMVHLMLSPEYSTANGIPW